jgi:pentatricopeptide repeat protein
MVDYYGIETDPHFDTPPPDQAPAVWNVTDEHSHQPWPLPSPKDAEYAVRLETLLEDDESPIKDVFDAYKRLPSPGVVYLPTQTIRTLLRHLSVVERPCPVAMQQYLSLLDDMKTANLHITRPEWTSAIYLAGRSMGSVSSEELQSALYIWRDMEHRANIKGGYVTLNVLFDIAVKAGKYSLAETFLKELQARGLELHRHFRISLIYYNGIMQDGHAVRRSYQELVDAGDIVDTVVMNAVIAALFRAGEPSAAEHVFERMKRAHADRKLDAPGHSFYNRTWRDRRSLGLYLTHRGRYLAKAGKEDKLKKLQDYSPIAPDSRTYALIIRHQATSVGNIDRIYELLREMRYHSVPLEGTIFVVMFRGFHSFGGVRYSSWTPDRLEKLWRDFVQAEADKLPRTYFSVMAVIAALKAFRKCTDADRTLAVWNQVRGTWQPNEEELESVMQELRKLISKPGFFDASQL